MSNKFNFNSSLIAIAIASSVFVGVSSNAYAHNSMIDEDSVAVSKPVALPKAVDENLAIVPVAAQKQIVVADQGGIMNKVANFGWDMLGNAKKAAANEATRRLEVELHQLTPAVLEEVTGRMHALFCAERPVYQNGKKTGMYTADPNSNLIRKAVGATTGVDLNKIIPVVGTAVMNMIENKIYGELEEDIVKKLEKASTNLIMANLKVALGLSDAQPEIDTVNNLVAKAVNSADINVANASPSYIQSIKDSISNAVTSYLLSEAAEITSLMAKKVIDNAADKGVKEVSSVARTAFVGGVTAASYWVNPLLGVAVGSIANGVVDQSRAEGWVKHYSGFDNLKNKFSNGVVSKIKDLFGVKEGGFKPVSKLVEFLSSTNVVKTAVNVAKSTVEAVKNLPTTVSNVKDALVKSNENRKPTQKDRVAKAVVNDVKGAVSLGWNALKSCLPSAGSVFPSVGVQL